MKLPNNNSCDMEDAESLPILLVSAKNEEAASLIITEILKSDQGELANGEANENKLDCLWKITNKYYKADVRVLALVDGEQLDEQLANSVEAHLIYLTHEECAGETALETVLRRTAVGEAAQIRLVGADASADPPRLAEACARAGLELVPLQEPEPQDEDEDEDDLDIRGVKRICAALHAHVWPGLERRGLPGLHNSNGAKTPDSSDDEWSEWMEGPRAGEGVEGVAEGVGDEEAFFAALASLPGAAAAARGAGGGREERLARAEDLVSAFCRALGTPLD